MPTNVSAVLITRGAEYPTDVRLDFPFGEVLVERFCPYVYRRFERAAWAEYDTIYVQDDDCQIDIQALWQHYQSEPGTLTYAITPGHHHIYRETDVALIGFGAFFPRWMATEFVHAASWWLRHFDRSLLLDEADRFFTWGVRHLHRPQIMRVQQFHRSVKMCERQGHYQTRDRIIARLKEMR